MIIPRWIGSWGPERLLGEPLARVGLPIVEQRHANNGLSSYRVSLLSDRYTIVRLKTCGQVTVKIFSGFSPPRSGRPGTIYTSSRSDKLLEFV